MMKNRSGASRYILLILLLIMLVCSGCVPVWTGDEMREDIAAIQAEQKVARESFSAEKERMTEMIASARKDVSELKGILSEARELLQRNNADLGVEVQGNREKLSEMSGTVEKLEFKIKRLEQDLELFKEDVDLRFDGTGVGAQLPEEAEPLFKQGKSDFDAAKFRPARKAFEQYMTTFASGKRAADAQFLIGMTYYRESQWVTSIFEFQKVVKNFENSPRVPDAAYHIGVALMKMDRCKQAGAWFDLLSDEYGNSSWTTKARQHQKSIKSGDCGAS